MRIFVSSIQPLIDYFQWLSLILSTVKRLFLFYEKKLDALAYHNHQLFVLTMSAINLFLISPRFLKHQRSSIMLPPPHLLFPKEIFTVLSVSRDLVSKPFITLVAFGKYSGTIIVIFPSLGKNCISFLAIFFQYNIATDIFFFKK